MRDGRRFLVQQRRKSFIAIGSTTNNDRYAAVLVVFVSNNFNSGGTV